MEGPADGRLLPKMLVTPDFWHGGLRLEIPIGQTV
jgi:hypothetical protein